MRFACDHPPRGLRSTGMNTPQPPEIQKDAPFSTAAARTLHQGAENATEAYRLGAANANQAIQQGKEQLHNAAQSAVVVANKAMQQGREQLQGAYQSASVAANTAMQHGRDLMEDTYHAAATNLENALIWSRGCVQRNPLSAAFGTLAIGIGLGLWASRQRRVSFQDRLTHDPVGTLREVLHSLSSRH